MSGIRSENYIKTLKERSKTSKVYRKYQLVGLELAELLRDPEHKALYIKLAKERDQQKLLSLAKDIAEKENVKNKGAYFMRVLHTPK